MANKRRLTCPITLVSGQYSLSQTTFSNISILSAITRQQHTFAWDATLELPIYSPELHSDSVISFRLFARLFQTAPKEIGFNDVRICSQRGRHLRTGPFTLTFEGLTETMLQKHIPALANGKTQSYELIDDQLRCVSESLHPTDADNFFKALLPPLERPNLSPTAMFVQMNICSPCADPSTENTYADLVLTSLESHTFVNRCQRLYHDLAHAQGRGKSSLLKDSNITETLNKVKAIPPLSELTSVMKNTIYNNGGHFLSDPALFRSVN
jgi:phosphatidylinositol 3-kinase